LVKTKNKSKFGAFNQFELKIIELDIDFEIKRLVLVIKTN